MQDSISMSRLTYGNTMNSSSSQDCFIEMKFIPANMKISSNPYSTRPSSHVQEKQDEDARNKRLTTESFQVNMITL